MIVIEKNRLKFILFLLILMEPGVFKQQGYEVADTAYTILKLAVIAYLLIKVVSIKKISVPTVLILVYESSILASTLINQNGYLGFRVFIGPALAAIGITVLFDIYKQKMGLYLWDIRNVFLVYVTINLVTVLYTIGSETIRRGKITFIQDMPATQYFFGMDNRFIFYYIPAILSALICSAESKRKKDVWILRYVFLQSLFSVFIVWSAGAIVGMVALGILLLVGNRVVSGKICNVRTFIIAWFAADAAIIFSMEKLSQFLINIAEDILAKGATFNHRIRMWISALNCISKSPVIGVGVKNQEIVRRMLARAPHAHNLLLNITFRGGLLAVTLFFAVLISSTFSVYIHRREYIAKCLAFGLLCCFLLSMADSYDDVYFYMILCFCSHYEYIVGENNGLFKAEKVNYTTMEGMDND